MDPGDLRVRNITYRLFVDSGAAPTVDDVAAAAQLAPEEIAGSWTRLHDGHALVLDPSGTTIRMANPFSAVATPHRVQAAGRRWYANCAWDAFGICAALHTDGTIVTTCPDCNDDITIVVKDRRPGPRAAVFHCLVPASSWWDDIGFT